MPYCCSCIRVNNVIHMQRTGCNKLVCSQVDYCFQETCAHCTLMVKGHYSFSLCRHRQLSIHHPKMAIFQSIGSRSTSHNNRSSPCAMKSTG